MRTNLSSTEDEKTGDRLIETVEMEQARDKAKVTGASLIPSLLHTTYQSQAMVTPPAAPYKIPLRETSG
jgi:hypothetical protein